MDPRALAEPFTALYTCPHGHEGLLDEHQIAADGTVTPSVVCVGYPAGYRGVAAPAEPCDFHGYVRLENWAAGR